MFRGNSLAVQWLGPGDFTAVASISGQGTKITQATQQSQKKKRGVGVGGRFREEHLTVTYNNNQTLSITCVPTVENPMNGEQKMYSNIRAYKIKGGRGMRSEKFSYRMFNSKTYCS